VWRLLLPFEIRQRYDTNSDNVRVILIANGPQRSAKHSRKLGASRNIRETQPILSSRIKIVTCYNTIWISSHQSQNLLWQKEIGNGPIKDENGFIRSVKHRLNIWGVVICVRSLLFKGRNSLENGLQSAYYVHLIRLIEYHFEGPEVQLFHIKCYKWSVLQPIPNITLSKLFKQQVDIYVSTSSSVERSKSVFKHIHKYPKP